MRIDTKDLAACRDLLKQGSRSFYFASRVLPARISAPATVLYAFCRQADDAVDIDGGQSEALARLSLRLDGIYGGAPAPHPVDRAMAVVVNSCAIPRALPDALVDGLAWDVAQRRYDTLADVYAYGARVAGSVGVMMALIMGVRQKDVLARAAELGIAMQLTNIARDIGDDARAGRLYLPRRWLEECSIDADAWLDQPVFDARIAGLTQRLLEIADQHYRAAEPAIGALPMRCRPGIRAASRIYAHIGAAIAANGHDSVNHRAVVGPSAKLGLVARATCARKPNLAPQLRALHAEIRFMVDAIRPGRAAAGRPQRPYHWWDVGARIMWVLELFQALEARKQLDSRPVRRSNENSRLSEPFIRTKES